MRTDSIGLRNWLVGFVMFTVTRALASARVVLCWTSSKRRHGRSRADAGGVVPCWRARLDYDAGTVELDEIRTTPRGQEIALLEQTGATLHARTAANYLRRLVPFLESDTEAVERGQREAAEQSLSLGRCSRERPRPVGAVTLSSSGIPRRRFA